MSDEMTLLGVTTLPGTERSAGYARRFAREVLGADHPAFDTVELCVSELVVNAVHHSTSGDGGRVTVAIATDGEVVRAEVTDDGGTGSAPYVRNEPYAEDGRGMLLVQTLSVRWGTTVTPPGMTVWFECSAERRP